MKKLISILAAVLINYCIVFAQAPQKMSYQAVIRNNSDTLLTSTALQMRISILQGSATGTAVYTETQTPSTNANGLVSLEIGTGTIIKGTFSGIDWSAGPYFIQTETGLLGVSAYTIVGTSELISVPYALFSANSTPGPQGIQGLTGATGPIGATGGITHYIGELYGGGIVVAVWKEAGIEKGLIASLVDISSGTTWSNVTGTLIGITAQSPIDGQANTNAIIAQSGHTASAAKLCDDYTAGAFSDWYLPAMWELNLCCNAAYIVNAILGASNGFQFGTYYASTEQDLSSARYVTFRDCFQSNCAKASTYRVRAVRKF